MGPTLILKLLFYEFFTINKFLRTPESELIMEGESTVEAFSKILSSKECPMSAYYQFSLEAISSLIEASGKKNQTIYDLGCGTGELLIPLALAFPEHSFIGVDLSTDMLNFTKTKANKLGIQNIRFLKSDFSILNEVSSQEADVVYSSMALHHCENELQLQNTIKTMHRILKKEGYFFTGDLGRVNSIKSVQALIKSHVSIYPPLLLKDYQASLFASFSPDEWSKALTSTFSGPIEMGVTKGAPMLIYSSNRPIHFKIKNESIVKRKNQFNFTMKAQYYLLRFFMSSKTL